MDKYLKPPFAKPPFRFSRNIKDGPAIRNANWGESRESIRANRSAEKSAVPKRGRSKPGRTQEHANARERTQKERKRKSAKERNRATKKHNNCKQPGLKQPGFLTLGTPEQKLLSQRWIDSRGLPQTRHSQLLVPRNPRLAKKRDPFWNSQMIRVNRPI